MRLLTIPLLLTLLPSALSFSCTLTASDIPYDLTPLSGLRTASKESSTPPTSSEARLRMDFCSPDGVEKEEDLSVEDQCPGKILACLKVWNHKSSATDPDRVTAVMPFWPLDLPDHDVFVTPLGQGGKDGLRVYVQGPDYAGSQLHLNMTLHCTPTASEPNPTLRWFHNNYLSLEWSSPSACPRDASSPIIPTPVGSGKSGRGFWGFVKFLFWAFVGGLLLYFGIGIFYNHQQYSAKGWDLIPHRDFWREFPVLVQDLLAHIFSGLRGGNSRGGYSSLG